MRTLSSSFNEVSREDVYEKYGNDTLLLPGGEGARCVQFLERYLHDKYLSGPYLARDLLGLYSDYAKYGAGLPTNGKVDLFVIQNAGMLVSSAVLHHLDKRIDRQASARLKRHFPQKESPEFEYTIQRLSFDPQFGKEHRPVLFIDPTVATGESIMKALDELNRAGCHIHESQIVVWTLIAAPFGIERLCGRGATIATGLVSHGLDEYGYNVIETEQGKKTWPGNIEQILAETYYGTA